LLCQRKEDHEHERKTNLLENYSFYLGFGIVDYLSFMGGFEPTHNLEFHYDLPVADEVQSIGLTKILVFVLERLFWLRIEWYSPSFRLSLHAFLLDRLKEP
tara:strand:- start:1888 stop:2190 length:303 start_codon:yes stop_codon:yes gene_type:complete